MIKHVIAEELDETMPRVNVSSDVAPLMTMACQMLITEMTITAATKIKLDKRKTIQQRDILTAIELTDHFDFLNDVVISCKQDEDEEN